MKLHSTQKQKAEWQTRKATKSLARESYMAGYGLKDVGQPHRNPRTGIKSGGLGPVILVPRGR